MYVICKVTLNIICESISHYTFCFVCPIARVSMSVPIKSYEHDSNKLERLMEKSGKCFIVHKEKIYKKTNFKEENVSFFNLTGLGGFLNNNN